MTDASLTYCAVHPDRETALRCNKCDRYMCVQCAVQTPVGYRCRECTRTHEDKFFKSSTNDYVLIFALCFLLTGGAAAIAQSINFIFILLIAGFPVGGIIGEAALRATKRRRGRHSGRIAAAGAAIGGFVGGAIAVYLRYQSVMQSIVVNQIGISPDDLPAMPFNMVFEGVITDIGLMLFLGLVTVAVYQRFRVSI